MEFKTALIIYGIALCIGIWGLYNELVLKFAFFGVLIFAVFLNFFVID